MGAAEHKPEYYGYFTESRKALHERCRANRQPHFTTDSTPNTIREGHTITQDYKVSHIMHIDP